MALTWSFDSLDIPSFSAMRYTLRVEVPVAYISATADTTARLTRWWRSTTSSEEKLPGLSFDILVVMSPTHVTRLRSR